MKGAHLAACARGCLQAEGSVDSTLTTTLAQLKSEPIIVPSLGAVGRGGCEVSSDLRGGGVAWTLCCCEFLESACPPKVKDSIEVCAATPLRPSAKPRIFSEESDMAMKNESAHRYRSSRADVAMRPVILHSTG